MPLPKILLAEDDESLGFVIKNSLLQEGFQVLLAADGAAAQEAFINEAFDICILDVMLPKTDGFQLAKFIREKDCHIPVIFLTARSLQEDKIQGLRAGADDYLTKPFSMEELLLKISIFLQRSKKENAYTPVVNIGSIKLDTDNLQLHYPDESKKQLTEKEARILLFFIRNKGRLLKREEILTEVWGDDDYFMGRSLDVFISRLRKYLQKDERTEILNVHGIGFKLLISG